VGLGHTIALATAARAEHENDPDFEDVERFSGASAVVVGR
jgi:hypothetical protein